MPWRRTGSIFALALLLLLQAPALVRTQPPTPTPSPATEAVPTATLDAQTVLNQANNVAALAQKAAEQNSTTIETIRFFVWAFGIILAITTAILGFVGFSTQRSFQDTLKEYREQLGQAQTATQENVEALKSERKKVEELREELIQLSESVRQEFADTKEALVLLDVGNQQFRDGKIEEAIAIYERVRSRQPNDAAINYALGRAYSNVGRYDDAITALQRAVNARPDFVEAHMELGLAHRRRAEQQPSAEDRAVEYRLAEHYLNRAIELRPAYEDALSTLGGLYRREERYPEALQAYQRAAMVDPYSSYALGNVANLSWYLGHERARYYFERVAELAQQRISDGHEQVFWPLHDLALAQLVLGRREEAMKTFEEAIAKTPHAENAKSVLSPLLLLKRAKKPIEGLDTFIERLQKQFSLT